MKNLINLRKKNNKMYWVSLEIILLIIYTMHTEILDWPIKLHIKLIIDRSENDWRAYVSRKVRETWQRK